MPALPSRFACNVRQVCGRQPGARVWYLAEAELGMVSGARRPDHHRVQRRVQRPSRCALLVVIWVLHIAATRCVAYTQIYTAMPV